MSQAKPHVKQSAGTLALFAGVLAALALTAALDPVVRREGLDAAPRS